MRSTLSQSVMSISVCVVICGHFLHVQHCWKVLTFLHFIIEEAQYCLCRWLTLTLQTVIKWCYPSVRLDIFLFQLQTTGILSSQSFQLSALQLFFFFFFCEQWCKHSSSFFNVFKNMFCTSLKDAATWNIFCVVDCCYRYRAGHSSYWVGCFFVSPEPRLMLAKAYSYINKLLWQWKSLLSKTLWLHQCFVSTSNERGFLFGHLNQSQHTVQLY